MRRKRRTAVPHEAQAPTMEFPPLDQTGMQHIDDDVSSAPAGVDLGRLRVAVVHDFLYTYAGAERVLGEILQVLPQADVFSLFDFLPEEERGFLKGKQVRTSFLQNLPLVKSRHRYFLPLMPLAIENLDVSAYDLVISSSHLAAKGVITSPHQLHICYCHSPARFAWDQQQQYLEQSGLTRGIKGFLARVLLHYIRGWDVRSAGGVDIFLANSQFVRHRIEKFYRRDATPVSPPVDLAGFPLHAAKEDFYLTASRLVPYKRIDVIVEAFSRMPARRLLVIGDGPEMPKLRRLAGGNVTLLGRQPQQALVDHMQRARAFVFAAEEDFGISPVEAQACGTPVIAFGRGGVTETVLPGETGVFFPRQEPEALIAAVAAFEGRTWDAPTIRRQAENFSREAFGRAFRHEVETGWARFRNRRGSACAGAIMPESTPITAGK